jgi:hypothetical protein
MFYNHAMFYNEGVSFDFFGGENNEDEDSEQEKQKY